MNVHLYALCWDEADMLGYFFRHYDPLVDRYVIYDDGSRDGSLEILKAHPRVEVRSFPRAFPDSFALSEQLWSNEVWKESRGSADWVIVTDLDEHLQAFDRNTADYLADCSLRGITIVPAIGYQMLSDAVPPAGMHLASHCLTGAHWPMMSKVSIFNPDAIDAIAYDYGRHRAQPSGCLVYPARDEMLLLHYKYMGFERTLRRLRHQRVGLGPTDIDNNWGVQYLWDAQQLRASWNEFAATAVDLGQPGFTPPQGVGGCWWREAAGASASREANAD